MLPRMRRRPRLRTLILAAAGLLVVAVAAGFAFFALGGDDAPAPAHVPASAGGPPSAAPDGTWAIAPGDDSYAGYRVREEYLTIGVRTAVGRTGFVTGTAQVRDGAVTRAHLTADLTQLHSDQDGRDRALQTRGLETATYPTARFTLTGTLALASRPLSARGRLTLHGVGAPVVATVTAARVAGGALVLAGSAPIRFADFGIAPPSTAGIVKVRDHGVLEFRLRLVERR
jgi:polyisoprenoid-binding protein YceI